MFLVEDLVFFIERRQWERSEEGGRKLFGIRASSMGDTSMIF